MIHATFPSPIGMILVDCDEHHVLAVNIIASGSPTILPDPPMASRIADAAIEQLRAYFGRCPAHAARRFDRPSVPSRSDKR
jgi:hypothetical protein